MWLGPWDQYVKQEQGNDKSGFNYVKWHLKAQGHLGKTRQSNTRVVTIIHDALY